MKTLIFLIVILPMLLNLSSGAGIRGSKHDFSQSTWTEGEICIACHTPHGSNQGIQDAPLWNRSLSTKVYTPYVSSTLKSAVGQPDGSSKLCLSCHDGTIAIDSFNGAMGTILIANPMDLNGQGHWYHPVSIIYDSNLVAVVPHLNEPSVTASGLGGTIQSDLLKNDKVQCSSCHDVHNAAGIDKLLKMTEVNLCASCHNN